MASDPHHDSRACTYQMYGVMDALKNALRPHLRDGDRLIWRDAFRWKDDGGVLSNHYECMELTSLADDFGYEIVHDFLHVAVVRKKVADGE